MKQIIQPESNQNREEVKKIFCQAAAREKVFIGDCTIEKILSVLDLKTNWNLITCWMYIYGYQRYTGNHVTKTVMDFVKIGIRRFVHNLAMHRQNIKQGVNIHGQDTLSAFIEKKLFERMLSDESLDEAINDLDRVLGNLSVCFKGYGYCVFIDDRSGYKHKGQIGQSKIVWMPKSKLDPNSSISK